jgi:hypothetical protein
MGLDPSAGLIEELVEFFTGDKDRIRGTDPIQIQMFIFISTVGDIIAKVCNGVA